MTNVRCIIDCTEVFIEKPSGHLAQAVTYSDYKKHNTVKYLVGVTPSGSICFTSEGWGGRTSDKQITIRSGFLNQLTRGDLIMADKGFLIEDELNMRDCKLLIPPGRRGAIQMSRKDVITTKKVANLRIHVERAIGRLKQFRVIKNCVRLADIRLLDDIFIIACAISNMSEALVRDD
jgi:hypothetical protein